MTDEQMIAEIEAAVREEGQLCLSAKHATRLLALAKAGMRLPRTADGVPVTPGMELYAVDPFGSIDEIRVTSQWEKRDTSSLPLPVYRLEEYCYSNPQAAEAAAAARAAEQENQ